MFYVYVLLRPSDMSPCYIGKGKNRRFSDHARLGSRHYNKHLAHIIKNAGGKVPHKIVFETNDEAAAFAREIELIAQYGRADLGKGTLCNMTDGGDGATGKIVSPQTRIKKSEIALNYHAKMTKAERRERSQKIW